MKKGIFLILIIFIFIVGCTNYNLSLDEFIEKATFNGYIIRSDKSGYASYDKVLNVYYAINREEVYDIQFLELKDEDYAHKFFLINKEEIKDEITGSDYEKSKSSSNYDLYHAENSVKYYLVIRCNKNIIYINAPLGYMNEIEEFLNDLNLEY